MDLRQLTYFLKIAERRSITEAAAELNVTQPTLTKSMKLLEQELGVDLFQRLPRGVDLTEYGRRLVSHAQAVRVRIDDAVGELEALRDGHRGHVTIGAGPAWLRRHLPLAVSRALEARPGIRVRVVGGFDEALLRGLRHGDLDFVVAELPRPQGDDLEIETLSSDRLCVCCRAGHPLVGRDDTGPRDLLAYPWVLPVQATRARQRLDALFVAGDMTPPEPAVETDSMAFILAAVGSSDALTYTTATTMSLPEGRGLVVLPSSVMAADRGAGIIQRKGAALPAAAEAIIDALRAVCRADPHN